MIRIIISAALLASGCTDIDRGGSVRDYAARAETHTGAPATQCMSACILLAVSDGGCITRDHRLTFHGASNATGEWSEDDWERWIAAQYGTKLGAWYLETGRHGMHTLNGGVLIDQFGLRECN